MSKLWIASKPVFGGIDHTYLVYDPDGDPNSGDEKIWNGYPDWPQLPLKIEIENWVPIAESKDNYTGSDPFTERNYTEVNTNGKTPEQVKDDLSQYAQDLGAVEGETSGTDIPYTVPIQIYNPETGQAGPRPGLNSNTTVKSGLEQAGIDFNANTPIEGGEGSGNARINPGAFPGSESYYSNGDGTLTIQESDNDRIIYNTDGNNTYDVTPNPFGNGQIVIVEDNNPNTTDNLKLHDIDPSDVTFQRTPSGNLEIYFPWDAGGKPSIVISNQWDGNGVPNMDTLFVFPPDGSAPVAIPLSNPEDFPMAMPEPLFGIPQWLNDWLGDWGGAEALTSPLVLDLDGNGIDLASVTGAGAVYWDIDVDGFAEASGWISGNDGLLAIDLNSDGVINDHSELFGTDVTDGFTVLSAYDSNSDNVIDTNDTQFGDLLVWVDANSNGFSEGTELSSLSDLGITSINLNASLVDYDIAGNHVTHESSFTINGQTQTIVDAWFAYDNTNSLYAENYTEDVGAMFLPTLRGFGDVKDLDIAMSIDEALLGMVQEVLIADADTLFDPVFDLQGKMTAIAYRWAGVDGVDPASRGIFIDDARTLEFFEKFLGDDFYQAYQFSEDPQPAAVTIIEDMFEQLLSNMTLSIMMQTDKAAFFDTGAEYNFAAGEMQNVAGVYDWRLFGDDVTNEDNVYQLGDNSGTVNIDEFNNSNFDQLWVSGNAEDARTWIDGLGYLHVRLGEISANEAIISAQGSAAGSDVYTRLEEIRFEDGTVWDLTQNLILTDFDTGNTLNGSSGKDILTGRGGNDHLYGKEGDDTYIWSVGDGDDIIDEGGGIDQLVLHGVVEDDIRFEAQYGTDLKIHVGSEVISVTYQFASSQYNTSSYDLYQIESLLLDDSTTIDLLNNLTFKGTDASETVSGLKADDILIGGLGNDTLNGKEGDDQYVWSVGDGDDAINETGGTDQLVLHGVTQDDIRFEAQYGTDLKVHVGSEVISVSYQFASSQYNTNAYDQYQVESLLLDDSTTIDLLNNLTFEGTNANETVNGLKLDDTLIGGLGNDTLNGKEGNDSYVWSVGDGNDYINEAGGVDQLVLHGVVTDDIRLEVQYGTNLLVHIGSETISLANNLMSSYYNSSTYDIYQVESIVLDDSTTIDLLNNLSFAGTSGSDNITGTKMADTLKGLDGSDYLYGSDGDDALYGGGGVDMLYGQAGADTFIYEAASAFTSSDNIQDFKLSENDKLDVSDLLIGYDAITDAIGDFVQITESNGNSYLSVDADGGADNFVQIAYIYNETGLTDENALETSGNLITV